MTTPARIKAEIFRAINEDFRRNTYGGDAIPIPARTYRLIEDAIKRACTGDEMTDLTELEHRANEEARHGNREALDRAVKRPSIKRWVPIAIDVTVLLSIVIVVTGFFVFLLELSAGRPAFLVPSFSAFFLFSIVGLVAFRLRRAVEYLQNAIVDFRKAEKGLSDE